MEGGNRGKGPEGETWSEHESHLCGTANPLTMCRNAIHIYVKKCWATKDSTVRPIALKDSDLSTAGLFYRQLWTKII